MKKASKPHWYMIYVGECPVCGRDQGYRERVYGKKPKDQRKCYKQLSTSETYDHCMER